MLSTGRLLRTTKLLCDLKVIEGTTKCSFHLYAVNNTARQRSFIVRRKQHPVAFGFVNFASSDASVNSSTDASSQVLSELGILPPYEETYHPAESKKMEDFTTFNADQIRENQDDFVTQNEVSAGFPSSNEVPLEAYELANQSEILKPSELVNDPIHEHVIELLLESVFESSVIPEPIPLGQDSTAQIVDQTPAAATTTPDITSTSSGIPELSSAPPEVLTSVVENIGRFGAEPSLQSIGLGSWSPVGIVQQSLNYFHVGLDLPWWGAIALGTLIIRLCVFPLVIMSQRNAAKMNNHLPEMQAIQLKMSDARERGDRLDAARYAQEMMEFMRNKGLSPLKNMIVPLCQAPFFVSMFMGIRGLASAPVESFKEGGLWWFTDLTLPDQFYLLPLITSATLALTVEVGTDMGRLNASMGMAKYLLRAMPIVIFPFTMNFPAGVLVYWCSTNFISLFQVGILRIPAVRDYFKIERIIKIDKKNLPIKEKGFIGGVKESWTNMKISRELEERERLDNANFLRAGRGAIKKTYKFDPTQPRPPRNLSSIQLKKRD